MAVSSTMLALGTSAPEFSLPDVTTGRTVSLQDFKDEKALLVMFLCAHCPYVVHVRPEVGFTFPFLFDESQEVAKAYSAACTPDFFLFDGGRKLVYRGQLDSSRPGRGPDRPGAGVLNGADLRAAIDAVLSGQPVSADQRPSIGCNIKWKPGNAPAYF